jgi:hypothetical protein
MKRHHKIFKTSSGLSTGKALLSHIIFSPSQTGETVPITWLHSRQLPHNMSPKKALNSRYPAVLSSRLHWYRYFCDQIKSIIDVLLVGEK